MRNITYDGHDLNPSPYTPMDLAPGEVCTSTWTVSIPTKKQLSLKILYYTVKLDGLPFYKLKERSKLKAEIRKTILIARIYGYYKIGRIK